jgi:hypothetical protein
MNTSRLLGAMCACLIACFSTSANATEDVVHIAKNSSHDIAVDNTAPRENQIKPSYTPSVENTVFVLSAGLIGFFLLRKANNG